MTDSHIDFEYYTRREREERARAKESPCVCARRAHLQLAAAYARKAGLIVANDAPTLKEVDPPDLKEPAAPRHWA